MRTITLFCSGWFVPSVMSVVCLADEKPLISFPDSFSSTNAATAYAAQGLRIGGGDVVFLKIRETDILVMFAHGSGVPTLAVAAYKKVGDSWQLQTQTGAPSIGEFYTAIVSGDEVLLVGEQSKQRWTLWKVK